MINEQKDRKQNPYPNAGIAEDDYSEESDANSVWLEGMNRRNRKRKKRNEN